MVARSGKQLWRASKGIIWIIHHLHFGKPGILTDQTRGGLDWGVYSLPLR
jgi:hypothetical protein